MIILDTMVLSEPLRPEPDPQVIAWLDGQIETNLFVTAITQAEMEFGLWSMPEGKRRSHLHATLTELFEVDFKGRILPFDTLAARIYGGKDAAVRLLHGKDSVKDMDSMIAAIAISHDRCKVATRDVRPFQLLGVPVVNPWEHVGA